ncbi:hypothetical protein PsorP6_011382 [Peronosclerospora sorghi]|uniref:Uncharacterized protein n=1 Tax=Peronosclerospora sorghi TaxID=230839 RepID=A0ACC0WKG7_9STRA|nr:hypothetical protein PsorP6_011382 [Peronosclerospora sorghi]
MYIDFLCFPNVDVEQVFDTNISLNATSSYDVKFGAVLKKMKRQRNEEDNILPIRTRGIKLIWFETTKLGRRHFTRHYIPRDSVVARYQHKAFKQLRNTTIAEEELPER